MMNSMVCFFCVDFRDHKQDIIIDDEKYHEMTSDEIRNTRQYYNEACSYYESYFGSPYEVYTPDSDHEESTIWILDSEVGDLYFLFTVMRITERLKSTTIIWTNIIEKSHDRNRKLLELCLAIEKPQTAVGIENPINKRGESHG